MFIAIFEVGDVTQSSSLPKVNHFTQKLITDGRETEKDVGQSIERRKPPWLRSSPEASSLKERS